MANFYTDSDNYSIEQKIDCLDRVISILCNRFDNFEAILLEIKNFLEEKYGSMDSSLVDDLQPTVNQTPISEVENEDAPSKITVGFCGQPDGPGFDDTSITEERGIRSLYEIRKIDSTHATFLPMSDKLSRFRNNVTSLLLPVCDVEGDISECNDIIIENEDWGELLLEDGNYWKVVKKCLIKCVNEKL